MHGTQEHRGAHVLLDQCANCTTPREIDREPTSAFDPGCSVIPGLWSSVARGPADASDVGACLTR
jgi:hypothetical protein